MVMMEFEVIVDWLTKSEHFTSAKSSNLSRQVQQLFICFMEKRFGLTDLLNFLGRLVTSKFWTAFQGASDTRLLYSTTYRPQTDGQSERTIQMFEDMLRSSVLQFGDAWIKRLDLMEIAYNYSCHSSIGMSPFEALYGKAYRTSLYWS